MPHGTLNHLLVCTDDGVQANGVGLRHALFARGAAMNIACDGSANMCFGASNSCLYVLEVDPLGCPTSLPAICLQFDEWTDDLGSSLVSADESGSLTVWEAASASSYKAVASLGEAKVPAVALAVRHEFVVAARLDGCIQVFSLRSKVLRAELAAHSRFLTCMDIHPTKDIIVTGAEDGSISVMTLPIGAQKGSLINMPESGAQL
ncbi:WD_REPEATS_REGION domain-containing protein, partial [Haematococcus lacustris]